MELVRCKDSPKIANRKLEFYNALRNTPKITVAMIDDIWLIGISKANMADKVNTRVEPDEAYAHSVLKMWIKQLVPYLPIDFNNRFKARHSDGELDMELLNAEYIYGDRPTIRYKLQLAATRLLDEHNQKRKQNSYSPK